MRAAGCYAGRVGAAFTGLGGEAGEEVTALRGELIRTKAELFKAQPELLTLRDDVIGYEAEIAQLRSYDGPRLESSEVQAALFLVKVGRVLRLKGLLRFSPIQRFAQYLFGFVHRHVK